VGREAARCRRKAVFLRALVVAPGVVAVADAVARPAAGVVAVADAVARPAAGVVAVADAAARPPFMRF